MAETFERLVIVKHRLSRIYCCPEKVKFEFLDRWKRKAWSDKEDRDDIAFWEQQKKEYLQLGKPKASPDDSRNGGRSGYYRGCL